MREISFSHPHRQKHFDFFRRMDQPHFGICAEVDISEFLTTVRRSPNLRFTPAIVYILTRAAQSVKPFRYRIRGERVVEHERLRPSFAVPADGTGVFSFCTVPYSEDPIAFHLEAEATIDLMRETPSFEDEEGADDYLFMSAFPWVSFTSVMHPMHYSPIDSVPRITWGKYFERTGKTMMPLAVQAHHATVDGNDLGQYYQQVELLLRNASEIFSAS